MILTKPENHCVNAWTPCSRRLSLPLKRRALCQTGPCQRLQDPRAPARQDVSHRTTPLARVLVFPNFLGKDKSLLSHQHRKRPKDGTNKTKSSFAVLFLSGSLVVRTRTLSTSSARTPSLARRIPTRSKCKRGSDNARLVSLSKAACQHFLGAYSGEGFLYMMSDRWANFWPPFMVRQHARH